MDQVQGSKAAGDQAFRSKHFRVAVGHYNDAVQQSEQHGVPDLLLHLYSNRSAAKLALLDFQGALLDAQAATAIDASWVKGWFRSAKALQGLCRHDMAVQAATKALQLDPDSKDTRQLLLQLKQQQQQQAAHALGMEQQRAVMPATQQLCPSAAHPSQQLSWQQVNELRSRLNLKQLPSQLVAGSRYQASPDGFNHNLLLLLHGLGDKPASFSALAQRMQLPQTASLALSGPLPVPETDGGRAWFTAFDDTFELIQPTANETRRTSSLAATMQLLRTLVFEVLPAAGGWRPGEIQVLGFSQGGTVALELARMCKGSQQLGGVVAVSASLLEEQLLWPTTATNSASSSSSSGSVDPGTDVLITHGHNDAVVTRQAVTRSVEALQAAGCDVHLKTLSGKGHGMISSAEEMRACMLFWSKRLKHRPADPELMEV